MKVVYYSVEWKVWSVDKQIVIIRGEKEVVPSKHTLDCKSMNSTGKTSGWLTDTQHPPE